VVFNKNTDRIFSDIDKNEVCCFLLSKRHTQLVTCVIRSHLCMCFSGTRGSRGTRQLKDFIGDGGERVNRQQHSAGDERSDSHEAVVSDDSDTENAAHHQPAVRSRGRRGQGRPPGSARGRYSEMRQQQGDISDVNERPRYSNARGRGFGNESRGGQRRGYGSRMNERREVSRDVEYRPEASRGPGNQPVGDRPKYDDRQPTTTRSGQSEEDWNEDIDTRATEQRREHFHATTSQPADGKMSELRLSHSDHVVSESVRFQRREDKHVPREPARRIHPTRTISNRHYQTADNIANKDRSSQIGGIVDAMNKISVKTAADEKRDVGMQQHVPAKSTAMIVSGMHYGEETVMPFFENTLIKFVACRQDNVRYGGYACLALPNMLVGYVEMYKQLSTSYSTVS